MQQRRNPERRFKLIILTGLMISFILAAAAGLCADMTQKTYVGAEACSECHEEQYQSFLKYAKKKDSFSSVLKMKRGLTPKELEECYACHTTGYGQPGGFVSEEKTPHLKNTGCEVCHGPGSDHIESEDPDDIIGELSVNHCEFCHNEERIGAFKYKPLIYGGAH